MEFSLTFIIIVVSVVVIAVALILASRRRKTLIELREILKQFKRDAPWLFRYGNPCDSQNLFKTLSTNDQKRLLYLALLEGDSDVRGMANYFAEKFYPEAPDLDCFSEFLKPADREKIVQSKPQ